MTGGAQQTGTTAPVPSDAVQLLRAEAIGRVFRASGSEAVWWRSPYGRLSLVALVSSVGILALAWVEKSLSDTPGRPSGLVVAVRGSEHVSSSPTLSLLEDWVALVVIVVALATPFYVQGQIDCMRDYGSALSRNGAFTTFDGVLLRRELNRYNEHVDDANEALKMIGRRSVSLVVAGLAISIPVVLYGIIHRHGLLSSLTPANLDEATWSSGVYSGWWANWDYHPATAVAIISIVAYGLYFLAKQLLLGAVFARFAIITYREGIGVTPQLAYNSDGYFGLRFARRFVEITYLSAISHAAMYLGVFFVWLPVRPMTGVGVAMFVALSIGVVITPTVIAQRGVIQAKQSYVNDLYRLATERGRSTEDYDRIMSRIDELWRRPNLPFRVRESFVAIVTSLIVPVALAFLTR